MNNVLNLNTLVDHVVFTIDRIFSERDYPEELLSFLYLITSSMIIQYGSGHIDDIYGSLENIKFTPYSLLNIKEYGDTKRDYYYRNPIVNNYLCERFLINSGITRLNVNYDLLYSNIDNSLIKTLEYLTYQINYILFNGKKKFSIKDSIKLRFDAIKNNFVYFTNNNDSLDTIFNVLQSEALVKNILMLRDSNIKNKKVKGLLDKLDVSLDCYVFDGMNVLVTLFRPLISHENIKDLIYSYDYKESIKNEFNNVLGSSAYNDISNSINSLNKVLNNSNGLINYYKFSNDYINIRNNYINRYIYLKYA